MSNILHSSASVEHYTPVDVIEAARATMGSITLDPASCAWANGTVGATKYYDKDTDGLVHSWTNERVFLNPPGGKTNGKSNAKIWWEKLVKEGVEQAIFVAFSLEFLQTAQSTSVSPMKFPFCIPKRRMKFVQPDGTQAGSPTHANAIIMVPPIENELKAVRRFWRYFSPIGDVVVPR